MLKRHHVVVDGVPIAWYEAGTGPPVVLLHGLPTGPSEWRYVIPLLRQARALAWELVGYAWSIPEGRGRDISVARQAEYLVAWMDVVGIDRAVLVGHDIGGGVAQIVAAHHPERVCGLVLTNAVCYDSWPIPEVRLVQALNPVLRRLPDPLIRFGLNYLFLRGHSTVAQGREALDLHWAPYAALGGAQSLERQVQSLRMGDTLEISSRLPHLSVPARIVWGAGDHFLRVGYGERLAFDLGAPLDRIERGKHFVPEDHPEHVAAAVNGLLSRE